MPSVVGMFGMKKLKTQAKNTALVQQKHSFIVVLRFLFFVPVILFFSS